MIRKIILAISIFSLSLKTSSLDLSKDEINFINVGQGHAVLVNKVGVSEGDNPLPWAPLLIDAGSTKLPYTALSNYTWGQDKSIAIQKISNKILGFWQRSHDNLLPGGTYHLNIIITHPDEDHKEFIPFVLKELEKKKALLHFEFTTFILLGGTQLKYNGFIDDPNYQKEYSSNCLGLFFRGDEFKEKFPFLNRSNCITHLFCPKGIPTDQNRWSIITRLEINGISAVLTGDADHMVKKGMLSALEHKQRKHIELESDILLAPHHGAEKTFYEKWDQAVNPKAIVVGFAPRKDYQHPRGTTIFQFLNLLDRKGRIWENRVMPHGCQYSGDGPLHKQIREVFESAGSRLFDCVPYNILEGQQQLVSEEWHLVWIDLPIYTLWTTGSMSFQEEVNTPHFIDAPGGMMPYVAVSEPKYLLSPEIRDLTPPLTTKERSQCDQLLEVIKEKYSGEQQNCIVIQNSIISEALPIRDPSDRSLYIEIISILLKKEEFLYFSPLFTQWVKEAIINRNKNLGIERLLKAATYIVPLRDGEIAQYGDPRGTWDWEWNQHVFFSQVSSNLDDKALVIKTFSKSLHKIEGLIKYIEAHICITNCGISNEQLENLCPYGFPEWLQLVSLVKFFKQANPWYLGNDMGIMNFIDITLLREQGKNFKEIAKAMIAPIALFKAEQIFQKKKSIDENMILEDRKKMIFQKVQQELLETLKKNFPDNLDAYLT